MVTYSLATISGMGILGEDLFIEYIPDSPDNCTSLFLTGSSGKGSASLPYDTATVQVRTRNVRSLEAYNACNVIYNVLQGAKHIILGEYTIVSIQALQNSPASMGRDDNGRQEFVQNYEVEFYSPTLHRS